MRGQVGERPAVGAVGPDEHLALGRLVAGADRLAANDGAEERALDDADASAGTNAREHVVSAVHAHEKGVVAPALDAQHGTAEGALGERRSDMREPIERGAHVGRQHEPGARRIVVEAETLGRDLPSHRAGAAMQRGADAPTARRAASVLEDRAARHDHRRIHRGVECRRRLGPVLEHEHVALAAQQMPDAAAGDRAPQLGGEEERQEGTGTQEPQRALGEQRGEIHL